MGIFRKIKEKTNSSNFSICQIDDDNIAIDLWNFNQTYIIDLKHNKIFFDIDHSDYSEKDMGKIEEFLYFLEENKDIII